MCALLLFWLVLLLLCFTPLTITEWGSGGGKVCRYTRVLIQMYLTIASLNLNMLIIKIFMLDKCLSAFIIYIRCLLMWNIDNSDSEFAVKVTSIRMCELNVCDHIWQFKIYTIFLLRQNSWSTIIVSELHLFTLFHVSI